MRKSSNIPAFFSNTNPFLFLGSITNWQSIFARFSYKPALYYTTVNTVPFICCPVSSVNVSYKKPLHMNWHNAIGILSTIALFAPVFAIFATGLFRYKQYFPILIYCVLAFGFNLMTEHLVDIPKPIERYYGIINNLTDMPLMLSFLMFHIHSSMIVKRMKVLLAAYMIFELVLVVLYGITVKIITLTMGPGLLIVFAFALYYFVFAVKRSFIHTKFIGKAFIASSLVFAYGCFFIIYIMHYVLRLQDLPNLFLIYYFITIIYCSLLATGLLMESKRKKKQEELLVTRKELMRFFSDEKKPASPKGFTGEWKLN